MLFKLCWTVLSFDGIKIISMNILSEWKFILVFALFVCSLSFNKFASLGQVSLLVCSVQKIVHIFYHKFVLQVRWYNL